jgi:hypothetical protein
MGVGLAVVMGLPLVEDDVQARLGRIAHQHGGLRAAGVGDPFDLVGQLDGDGLRIEAVEVAGGSRGQ